MKIRNLKCVLCGEVIFGYGHNAQPLSDGRCCDNCNTTKVVPARMKAGLKDWREK